MIDDNIQRLFFNLRRQALSKKAFPYGELDGLRIGDAFPTRYNIEMTYCYLFLAGQSGCGLDANGLCSVNGERRTRGQ